MCVCERDRERKRAYYCPITVNPNAWEVMWLNGQTDESTLIQTQIRQREREAEREIKRERWRMKWRERERR